ncbi:MAG: hypothetical protein GY884_10680, partial [Proteobacteria bacterium]|nr:hypothetical protein [Pseudomonadota bacterium]
ECGGDDCAIDDPWVAPGLEEWCDDVDHDCDGEPLEEGVCAKPQEVRALATVEMTIDEEQENPARYAYFIGDVNAALGQELVIPCNGCLAPDGTTRGVDYIWSGLEVEGPVDQRAQAVVALVSDGWEQGFYVSGTTDFDGDGELDLIATSSMLYDTPGMAYVLPGPIDGWPYQVAASEVSSQSWVWYPSWYGGEGLVPLLPGDLDGDGRGDLVVMDVQPDEPVITLVLGRNRPDEPTLTYGYEEPELYVTDKTADGGFGNLNAALGDIDGDGGDDFLLGDRGDEGPIYVLDGHATASSPGAAVEDALLFELSDQSVNRVGALGDLDDDGYADWYAADSDNDTNGADTGAIWVFRGGVPESQELTIGAAHGILYGVTDGPLYVGGHVDLLDFDGDGHQELIAGSEWDGDRARFLVGLDGLPSGTAELSPDFTLFSGSREDLELAATTSVGDPTGEGYDYILFNGYTPGGEEPGGFLMVH